MQNAGREAHLGRARLLPHASAIRSKPQVVEFVVVPAPSDDWFEASVTCATAQDSDFEPTDANAFRFTSDTGGENASDDDADPAEFEVDCLCWRK